MAAYLRGQLLDLLALACLLVNDGGRLSGVVQMPFARQPVVGALLLLHPVCTHRVRQTGGALHALKPGLLESAAGKVPREHGPQLTCCSLLCEQIHTQWRPQSRKNKLFQYHAHWPVERQPMPGPFGTSALSWLRGLRVARLTSRFHSLERYAVRFLTMGPVVWQPAGTAASNMCCAPALIPCDFLDTPDITASACYSAPHRHGRGERA